MANDKVISTQALIELFQQALDDGWGYIWGTAGVKWTQARQDALDKTTDADRALSRQYGAKWIGHMVADCSGLFTWAFKQLGGTMYHGSDTMFRKWTTASGTLKDGKRTDGKELLPGTAVFTFNSTKKKYGHVGLYIGNGWVIEAAGTKQGVIRSKVTNSKWTYWGELKGVNYGNAEDIVQTPAPEPTQTRPTIRRGNKNVYVKEMQTMLDRLGYNLGICGVDGDYGTATEKAVREFQRDHGLTQDGICGPKTWAALQEATDKISEKPEPVKTYTVTISGLTDAKAKEIVQQYGGVISAE